MHKAIKKAAETAALQDTREALTQIAPRLERLEAKLDRVLVLLEQSKPIPPLQQQRGGR